MELLWFVTNPKMGKELLKLKEESKIKRDRNIIEGKDKLDFNEGNFHKTWEKIMQSVPKEYSYDDLVDYKVKSKFILPTFKKDPQSGGIIIE